MQKLRLQWVNLHNKTFIMLEPEFWQHSTVHYAISCCSLMPFPPWRLSDISIAPPNKVQAPSFVSYALWIWLSSCLPISSSQSSSLYLSFPQELQSRILTDCVALAELAHGSICLQYLFFLSPRLISTQNSGFARVISSRKCSLTFSNFK